LWRFETWISHKEDQTGILFPSARELRNPVSPAYLSFACFIGVPHQRIAMAQLTPEIMAAFKSGRIYPLATASKDGEPNVAPMGAVFPRDPETIWIGNQFMKTTIRNVLENSRACLYVWGQGITGCYKIKGNIEVRTEGKDYETMRDEVAQVKPGLFCRSLLVMKITDVYECMPGEHAGDRLI
jgi:uncharacterized protein